ncbi:MAG: hypothetical protein ABJV04_06635 [Aliiglaciecola sp.]|uniref:hypothetical protein n=1 Tax=Aliiglaciecola sp. TaxID=1872441 RepID=UPI0032969328
MKVFVLIIFLLPSLVNADNLDINVNEGFLGAKWLSSQKEVEAALGKPNGYYRINKNRTLLFYGKSVSLLISRDRFRAVSIGGSLSEALAEYPNTINTKYEISNLTINGKPFFEQNFKAVEEALEIELGSPSYNISVGTDEVTINMKFSGIGGYRSEDVTKYQLRELSFAYQL